MTTTPTVNGIDVSHFQGTVDWAAVKAAGKAFAFAKASDGITYTDPQFKTNWQGIKAAGLLRGAYHFYESNDDPVAQANNFIKAVGTLAAGDLPPVLDIEIFKGNYGTATLAANVQTWLNTVQQALGRTPIIYTGPSFWNQYMNNQFSAYPLWIAQYGVSQPTLPNGWSKWTFWQSSESGTVAGVTGSVDIDVFAGSMANLLTLAKAA
ncbi:GH25 family lysozyme [Undibacterium sp. TS12]|uniref:glycoside hydrolase family 25 protein n=1 Tax=Undibacterium sp. TS12 TaxID=2908202 RepID=UPI001F4D2E46|nr:GH25 family lysozyme [Undibacterium sp. TS12]MCH8622401.1 lysozyme [Undibacterium sp. TS12]